MNTCVLCRKRFKEFPNNPWPLSETGVCCAKCDDTRVTPARMVRQGYDPKLAAAMGRASHRAITRLKRKVK